MNKHQHAITIFSSIEHSKLNLILHSHLPNSNVRLKFHLNRSEIFKYDDSIINIEKLVRLCDENDSVLFKFLTNPRIVNGIRALDPEKFNTLIQSNYSIDELSKILRNPTLVRSINSIHVDKLKLLCENHNANSSIANMSYGIINTIHWRIDIEKLKILKDNPRMNLSELFRHPVMGLIIWSLSEEKIDLLCQYYGMGMTELVFNPRTVNAIRSMEHEKLMAIFAHYRIRNLIELFNDQTFVNAINSIESEKIWHLIVYHTKINLYLIRDPYLARVVKFIKLNNFAPLALTYEYDDLEKVLRMKYLTNFINLMDERRVKILCETCQGESLKLLENVKVIDFFIFVDLKKLRILPVDILRNILINEKVMNWIEQVDLEILNIIEGSDIVKIGEGYDEKMNRILDFAMTLYKVRKIKKIDFHFIKEGIYDVMKNAFPEDIPTDQVLVPSESDFGNYTSLKDLAIKTWILEGKKWT